MPRCTPTFCLYASRLYTYFGLLLASKALRCSAPQPGTVYLLRFVPPNCRWAPSSACWRLSFSNMREPSSGAVVTEQRVRRRIQISGLNSTQLNSLMTTIIKEQCARSVADLVEFLALCGPEAGEIVCHVLVNLTEAHVTEPPTHLTNVQQRRTQRLHSTSNQSRHM